MELNSAIMKVFAYFLLLMSFARHCSSEETFGKVVFANILYRHGDRTPLDPYPTDPYKNENLWPVPFGQLTNLGKNQQLNLGRWLRERYDHLLSREYSVRDIYVLSTDVDRTLMSAEANLAGMYSPFGARMFDMEKWTPIPVHTVPEHEDNILAEKKHCDKYTHEFQRVLDSSEIKKINEDNADLYRYLSRMTGKEISSLRNVESLYNTLYVEELYNKTLPAWTKSVYPHKLKPLAEKNFEVTAYNRILQRLIAGPLLKEMIDHMQRKSSGVLMPNRKLSMYSAHDYTIANMLMALEVFEPHCPPYAATLMIELRINAEDDHVVTMFYKNTSGDPILLTLPGCIAACPLNQFVRLTKDIVPDNWELECLELDTLRTDVLNAFLVIIFLLITLLVVYTLFKLRYGEPEDNQNRKCNFNMAVIVNGVPKNISCTTDFIEVSEDKTTNKIFIEIPK